MICNNLRHICSKLELVCRRKGISSVNMRKLLGISYGTWYNWNTRKKTVSLAKLKRFCDSVGIPIRYVIDDSLNIEEAL